MTAALWFTLIGLLLIGMAITFATLKRMPFTAAIVYLIVGLILGKILLKILVVDPVADASQLRLLTEMVVLISLFSAGLKLRLPLNSVEWIVPILLATVAMVITVSLIGLFASYFLGLSLGAAILLGAILAPTDPVLASSVQVLGPGDADRLRFGLTGEAGLNDGTAMPFVLLGLHLVRPAPSAEWLFNWVSVDLIWGTIGGIGLGTVLGALIGKLVQFCRIKSRETQSLDDFLALGLVALSYGISLLAHANGFLAVFAAGLAMRRRERSESRSLRPSTGETQTRTDTASGQMALALLEFNEQVERLGELIVVVLIGAMFTVDYLHIQFLSVALFVILFARPLSVLIAIPRGKRSHRILLSWFGIRGVGSLFYLTFAIEQGLPSGLAKELASITLSVILTSIVIHGISATPLMRRHKKRQTA